MSSTIWRQLVRQARSGLLRTLRRETREAAALRQSAVIAASATSVVDALDGILEAALGVLPSDYLVLLRVSGDRTQAVIVAAAGTAQVWRGLRAPLGAGIVARTIETGKPELVSDGAGDPAAFSGLVVPVILHGSVFGVLSTVDERHRFTQGHATLLRKFAAHCCIAIDGAGAGGSG